MAMEDILAAMGDMADMAVTQVMEVMEDIVRVATEDIAKNTQAATVNDIQLAVSVMVATGVTVRVAMGDMARGDTEDTDREDTARGDMARGDTARGVTARGDTEDMEVIRVVLEALEG